MENLLETARNASNVFVGAGLNAMTLWRGTSCPRVAVTSDGGG